MNLVVSCFWWTENDWPASYTADHVRQLKDAVRKNLTIPHEFVCLTDNVEAFELDHDIRAVPLDMTTAIPGTEFVKLMTFSPEAKNTIGDRILQLDLDTIIVGNLDKIVDRDEDTVVWRNPARLPYDNPVRRRCFYNGSVILHRAGTAPHIFTGFVPEYARKLGGPFPTTQEWMSEVLGPNAPYWDHNDGIYRLARADTPGSGIDGALPANAKLVAFVGSEHKPWHPAIRSTFPWVTDHWPEVAA